MTQIKNLEVKSLTNCKENYKIRTKNKGKISKTLPNKQFLTSFFKKIKYQPKLLITLTTSKITIKNKKQIFLQIHFTINIKMLISLSSYINKSKNKNSGNVRSIQK